MVELLKENYGIEQEEFSTSLVQQIFEEINCVRCTTGILKPRVGNFKSFFSCSHFPLCDHKEEGCEICGSPMTRKRFTGFKVCLNDSCSHIAPICSVCGGDMKLRKGPYGEFWGCINFRRDNPTSCSNKIKKQVATHTQDL